VNPFVTPSVTIASSDADNNMCSTDIITFTATPVDGGTAPTYQWLINGGNVGTGGATFSSTLNNGDVVSVVMTANNACQTTATATSNTIANNVTLSLTPTVSIVSSDADNTICAGESVTFTATGVDGGSAPTYQWQVNGGNVGTGGTTFTTATLNNNDVVTVIMTANNVCQTTATATSNGISTVVNPLLTPAVAITSSDADNSICTNDAVTFTAVPTDGGTAPTYQWQLNGGNVGTGGTTFTTSTLNSGDVVSVIMTANNSCQTTAVANSNTIATTVVAPVTPSVGIVSSDADNNICLGESVTFTATPTDGGTAPTYQWLINGGNVGIGGNTFTSTTLVDGDVVSVVMTANNVCQTAPSATSNTIATVVNAVLTPTVTVSSTEPDNAICAGTSVTYTATSTGGGTAPAYQWFINGVVVAGEINTDFTTSTLNNSDTITVSLLNNANCLASTLPVLSADVIVQVDTVINPSASILINGTSATDICEGSTNTISLDVLDAGTTVGYQWLLNGTDMGITSSTFDWPTLVDGDQLGLIVSTSNACQNIVLDTVFAVINALPIQSSSISIIGPASLCELDANADTLQMTPLFVQGVNYFGATYEAYWIVDGVVTTQAATPGEILSLNDLGATNTVQLVLVDNYLCPATDSAFSTIINVGDAVLYFQDADGDGFGNPLVDTLTCGNLPGYVLDNTDCSDNNPNTISCDGDGDGFTPDVDCDDTNPAVNPDAIEICENGIDDNCDGVQGNIYYWDADNDGFATSDSIYISLDCTADIIGFIDADSVTVFDCNNFNNTVYPGAPEICDGLDNDCNSFIDDGAGVVWYYDNDQDGFGTPDSVYILCFQPGPNWVSNSVDCNDNDPLINPALDLDGDGFFSCINDCDDQNPNVNPAAAEVCNYIDDNCNNLTDEGLGSWYYPDLDGDGYGSVTDSVILCAMEPGYVDSSSFGDCDDNNYAINPGAEEICGNDIDENCDGEVETICPEEFPDAFSPNDDGISDIYEYTADNRDAQLKMEVYNRWGTLVYVTESIGRVQWDGIPNRGKNDSELLPVGTYFAVFTENGVTRTQAITIWY
jgi:gliding motility-associated-like protein